MLHTLLAFIGSQFVALVYKALGVHIDWQRTPVPTPADVAAYEEAAMTEEMPPS